jgi:uncharacterized protein YycO
MRRATRLVAVCTASLALALGTVTSANASESGLDRLLELHAGVEKDVLVAQIEQEAAAQGTTFDAVVDQVLAEARAAAPEAVAADGSLVEGAQVAPLSSSGGSGTVKLVNASRKGDVFYSPAGALFVTWGHNGIYYSTSGIVEAPGPGANSRYIAVSKVSVVKGAKLQYVSTTSTNRNKAANYAYNNLRGRGYNLNFAFNKKASGSLNCSQLVWAAYREAAGIDLDSNGGTGVYPANIRDDNSTVTYRTL